MHFVKKIDFQMTPNQNMKTLLIMEEIYYDCMATRNDITHNAKNKK